MEKLLPKAETLKAEAVDILSKATVELGADTFTKFGGFYYEDSNARAVVRVDEILLNEKWLGEMDTQEMERVSCHEIQHLENVERGRKMEDPNPLYYFVLHPSFAALHARMDQVYNEKLGLGYIFGKKVAPIPISMSDIEPAPINYAHPDELLALLRGYECYIKQLSQGQNPDSRPYEFIEAFKPDDLRLLDEEYRMELAAEVTKDSPEAVKTVWLDGFSLDLSCNC